MKLIENKNAMKVFYYLMAADGEITADEVQKFDELGNGIDPASFAGYRDELMTGCRAQLSGADDEYYDIVQEAMDTALVPCTGSQGGSVSSRLLIWDMLAVAFSNAEYSEAERRMISHAARVLGVDKSVYMEMEQLIKTAAAVEREAAWIKATDKPYSEVQPIVEELDKRMKTILESAAALIDDDVESADIYEVKEDFVDKSKAFIGDKAAKVGEKVKPVASDVGEKARNVFGSAKAKVSEKAGKLLDGMKKHKEGADNGKRGE